MTQFVRYTISGGVATLVHFVTLALLVELVDIEPTLGTGLGFTVAIMVNYTLQHYWVFGATGSHKVFFLRYVWVTLMTFVMNIGIFWFGYHIIGLWYLLAQAFATGFIFILNFAINRAYTFRIGNV